MEPQKAEVRLRWGFFIKNPAGAPSHSKQQALHWSPPWKCCKGLGASVQ